ncbi:calmodulin-binding protein 60 D-like [Eucalyptus grandis]|uniref:calmodulin-binding protein 60 D-like n=1 Tax=Eucalyptus grandis TaxID=71139 RepID=UPI00192EB075|nr:calmodulin-binding protein 60 D-like [Eucalyptus grandis]
MSAQKRGLPSTSSGQASLLKRLRAARTNQTWRRSGRNLVPRSWLMEEDVRRVVREELERAKISHSAEYCQSCPRTGLEGIVHSLQNAVQKLEEAAEPANSHSPHRRRANAKTTAKTDARNLKLQLQNKLSLPLFTGKKIEGKEGAPIRVALIDADTGDVITSGVESSIKLDVVVLEGDFNKDDQDNWAQEEFEKYVAKERAGKGSLLTGDLLVTLKKGVGELGDMIFTDNSSWNRSKRFRIGLKVASGYCWNTRIREAVTDAFRVKEHRGESSQKNYPPKSDDEVWRLEKIAKDGKCHEKLVKVGIHKVEDFLLQLFTDSDKLREILGKSIIPKSWDSLVRHAKTCQISRILYLYYLDSMRKRGALFDADGKLIGLIKDRVYVATHQLSAQEKEHGDTIVKKAFDNSNDVMKLNGDTFSPSIQMKSSSCIFEGQIENLTLVQRNLASQICVAPGGPEAPLANVSFTTKDQNAMMFLADQPIPADNLNVLFPPGNNSTVGLPKQSHDINLQYLISSPGGYIVNEHVLPSGATYASLSSFKSSSRLSPLEGIHGMADRSPDYGTANWLAGIQNPPDDDIFFQTSPYSANRNAWARWMKIFVVLKWFCHIRKRRVRVCS